MLDRLLQIGWNLSGVSPDEAEQSIEAGFRQIFVASEVIDDLQDAIQPFETARLNNGINDGLEALISGLIALPPNCLRYALQSIYAAISGQKQDVSTTIAHASMSHKGIAEHCESVSLQKTGSLIQLAFTLPWLSRNEEADNPPAAIVELGTAAGVAIQALNDWEGLQSAADSEDVFHGRVTWVWEWLSGTLAGDVFEQLRSDAGACIGDQQLAHGFRDQLVNAVDEESYLQWTRDRYRSALARISTLDDARAAAQHANAGEQLESTLFPRTEPQLPDG